MLVINKQRNTTYFESVAERSDTQAAEKEWMILWSVKVPTKIRIFLWRLARQSLATTDVLDHTNMKAENICALCGAQDSCRHALLECNIARCVWALERDCITEIFMKFRNQMLGGGLRGL